MKSIIKVAKFELYPADEPTGYAVGFSYQCEGGAVYRDTVVPLSECDGLGDEEICDLAFEELRTGFEATISDLDAKSSVIGKEYKIKAPI